MISFGTLLIALVSFIVTIVIAFSDKKK